MSTDIEYRRNLADGGANGATATTATTDDAGGDILDISTGGTRTYSNAYAHSSSPTSFRCYGNGAAAIQAWNRSGHTWSSFRSMVYFPTLPTSGTNTWFQGRNTADVAMLEAQLQTNGKIRVTGSGGTQLWLSTATFAATTEYRAEIELHPDTTSTGYVTVNMYAADTMTLVDGFTTSTANLGTLPFASWRWGKLTVSGEWAAHFAALALVTDTEQFGLIGPYKGDPSLSVAIKHLIEVDVDGSAGVITVEQLTGTEAVIEGPDGDLFFVERPEHHSDVLTFLAVAAADGPPITKLIKVYPQSVISKLQYKGTGDPANRENWR
ncbi:MAG: hypothetical protein WC054_02780 [Candidatus Nanopelagicales bacterium]